MKSGQFWARVDVRESVVFVLVLMNFESEAYQTMRIIVDMLSGIFARTGAQNGDTKGIPFPAAYSKIIP